MTKSGEVPAAEPPTRIRYRPGRVRAVNVIGYTSGYRAFHGPLLVPPTAPVRTVWPDASSTLNVAPRTGPGAIRYPTFASPGRYPTWSTRTSPATAASAGADATAVPVPASARTAMPMIGRIRRIASLRG